MTGHETSPTGEPAAPEQVGLAIRAMAIGVLAGACFTTMALWGQQMLLQRAPVPAGTPVSGPAFYLVVGGTFGGMALAAALTWLLLHPVASAYRRGGFSMVALFATFLVSLPTAIVNQFAGRWGLLGFAALCGFAALLLSRRLHPEPHS